MILSYILKTIWMMAIILWDIEWVWQDFWPQNKCHLYSMVKWFFPLSWGLFDGWTSYFGVVSQCDIIINVGHSDLYFMVQRLCPVTWRLMLQVNVTVWNKDLPPNSGTYCYLIFWTGVIQVSYAVMRQLLLQCWKTADMVWLSLFMRDTGKCNIFRVP